MVHSNVWLYQTFTSFMESALAVPSAATQRRIASHLDSGITPSVRGNRVVLKGVVLVKANGERAPAAAEAERQAAQRNISWNIALWGHRSGNRVQGEPKPRLRHLRPDTHGGTEVSQTESFLIDVDMLTKIRMSNSP